MPGHASGPSRKSSWRLARSIHGTSASAPVGIGPVEPQASPGPGDPPPTRKLARHRLAPRHGEDAIDTGAVGDAARRRRVRRCAANAGRRGGPAAPGPQRAPASRGRARRTARRGARRRRAPGRSGGRGSARRRARRCRRAAGATRAAPGCGGTPSRYWWGPRPASAPGSRTGPGSHAGAGGAAGGSGVHAGEAVEAGAPQQVEQHRLGWSSAVCPVSTGGEGGVAGGPGAGLEVGAGLHPARTPRNARPSGRPRPAPPRPRRRTPGAAHGRHARPWPGNQPRRPAPAGPANRPLPTRRTSPRSEPVGSRTWPAGRRSVRHPEALPPIFPRSWVPPRRGRGHRFQDRNL